MRLGTRIGITGATVPTIAVDSHTVQIDDGTGGSNFDIDNTAIFNPGFTGDFGVEFKLKAGWASSAVFGVQQEATATSSNNYQQIDYGIQMATATTGKPWENNVGQSTFVTAWAVDDVIRIERVGDDINYKYNGSTERTVGGASGLTLYPTWAGGPATTLMELTIEATAGPATFQHEGSKTQITDI